MVVGFHDLLLAHDPHLAQGLTYIIDPRSYALGGLKNNNPTPFEDISTSAAGEYYIDPTDSTQPLKHAPQDSWNPMGYIRDSRTNRIIRNTSMETGWTVRGTADVDEDADPGPRNNNTGALLTGIDGPAAGDDVFQIAGGYTNNSKLVSSLWIKRASTSGILELRSPIAGGGSVDIDMSLLPDKWIWLTEDHAAWSEDTAFSADASGDAGLQFVAGSGGPLSFYVYGAQQEEIDDYSKRASFTILTEGSAVTSTATNIKIADGLTDDFDDTVGLNLNSDGRCISGTYVIATIPLHGHASQGQVAVISPSSQSTGLAEQLYVVWTPVNGRVSHAIRTGAGTYYQATELDNVVNYRQLNLWAGTWSRQGHKLYVDGTERGSSTAAGGMPKVDASFLGSDRGFNSHGGQCLQLLLFYDRELSQPEIAFINIIARTYCNHRV